MAIPTPLLLSKKTKLLNRGVLTIHRKGYIEITNDEFVELISSIERKLENVVEDTSPQLGGNLDVNGNDITGNPAIDGRRAIIVEAGTNRTLSSDDAGDFIIATNVDEPTTITIPTNASVAFTTGTEVDFIRKTAQELTIEADAGVTLNGVDGGSTAITAQWGGATIKKIDTDEWIIVGKINTVA
jgi:hypothetical protein